MIRLMTLILFLVILKTTNAQVEVYKTYSDYQNNISAKYADFLKNKIAHVGQDLIFLDDKGEKVKINSTEIWGFKYKNTIFRFYLNDAYYPMAAVVNIGKLVYYENGIAYMEMLKKNKDKGSYDFIVDGNSWYFSKDLNSEIEKANKLEYSSTKYPEYKELYDCLMQDSKYKGLNEKSKKDEDEKRALRKTYLSNLSIKKVRECISSFEGKPLFEN